MRLREKRLRIRATGEYSKKYYLTQYVNDHGIWQEENIWKSVLQKVLNQKFQEAVQKDKERKEGKEGKKTAEAEEIASPSGHPPTLRLSHIFVVSISCLI